MTPHETRPLLIAGRRNEGMATAHGRCRRTVAVVAGAILGIALLLGVSRRVDVGVVRTSDVVTEAPLSSSEEKIVVPPPSPVLESPTATPVVQSQYNNYYLVYFAMGGLNNQRGDLRTALVLSRRLGNRTVLVPPVAAHLFRKLAGRGKWRENTVKPETVFDFQRVRDEQYRIEPNARRLMFDDDPMSQIEKEYPNCGIIDHTERKPRRFEVNDVSRFNQKYRNKRCVLILHMWDTFVLPPDEVEAADRALRFAPAFRVAASDLIRGSPLAERSYLAAHIREGDFTREHVNEPWTTHPDLWFSTELLRLQTARNGEKTVVYIASERSQSSFASVFPLLSSNFTLIGFEGLTRNEEDSSPTTATTTTTTNTVARLVDTGILVRGVNDNALMTQTLVGIVEMLVCACGAGFVGTPASTFSDTIATLKRYTRDLFPEC